jgi:glycosyltransferase involved in cell wall biosynthesis
MNPRVTFLVPCYKLAHLLGDCVNSILMQSYRDFEVLIMDDCSPDHTPEVAATFRDPRVRYVRNPVNLGHLKNYNEGIRLARGHYLWLVSADDRLRLPYVLERFVALLDQHRDVGMAFCPGVNLHDDGREGAVQGLHGDADVIFERGQFLSRLIHYNSVCTPAAIARKECYERMGMFPLDLPYAGDWYVWCFIALHDKVAYLAEPMVNYRYHDANITKLLMNTTPRVLVSDVIAVRRRIRRLAEQLGMHAIARLCSTATADDYARRVTRKAKDNWLLGLTLEEVEASLDADYDLAADRAEIRAGVYGSLGDVAYVDGDFRAARRHYTAALRQSPTSLQTWAKLGLVPLGHRGARLRREIGELQRRWRGGWNASVGAPAS